MTKETRMVKSVKSGNIFRIEDPIKFNGQEYHFIELEGVSAGEEGDLHCQDKKIELVGLLSNQSVRIIFDEEDVIIKEYNDKPCLVAQVNRIFKNLQVNKAMYEFCKKHEKKE